MNCTSKEHRNQRATRSCNFYRIPRVIPVKFHAIYTIFASFFAFHECPGRPILWANCPIDLLIGGRNGYCTSYYRQQLPESFLVGGCYDT